MVLVTGWDLKSEWVGGAQGARGQGGSEEQESLLPRPVLCPQSKAEPMLRPPALCPHP